ncbi:hypothetical protein KIL84_013011 [Mauremys mutica]|uniref:Uncharacterized protein n=1 Tax=Mauremys mutica TaxID=74926 RepID=A0A9D4B950_9SAUR|nr:hypothetical protein KIL84_013011 [Mauremys mutica]
MLIPAGGVGVWCCCCCCGVRSPRQMLRHQSLLKCRCRMLFNDLKVFLLRRPPAPPPPLPMDSGANNNTLPALHGGRGGGWRAPAAGGGGPASPPEEEWSSPAGEPPASAMSSASSEDFCKGKAEDRYSLGSSLDSGMRTPLCRICFQGPEQSIAGLTGKVLPGIETKDELHCDKCSLVFHECGSKLAKQASKKMWIE